MSTWLGETPPTPYNRFDLDPVLSRVRYDRLGNASEKIMRLYDEVAQWTYKPGWQFWVLNKAGERSIFEAGAYLHIEARLLDSRGSGRTLTIQTESMIPRVFAEHKQDEDLMEEFRRWFVRQVENMEYHELREWLRRGGELYDDPHRKVER